QGETSGERFEGVFAADKGRNKVRVGRPRSGSENVIGCRVDVADLEVIDLMVEAGIKGTRSEAAAWFIHEGIKGQQALVDDVRETVAEIRRLREQAQARARERAGEAPPSAATEA
ncbi:MAG TPA: hypothetical protein VHN78_02825, partial [Chloroflexota bacterium]|nr:hypothetical protein [Chloroflexota bacterium]